MSDKSECWACGYEFEKGILECPDCGMPVEDTEDQSEDISFLDDLMPDGFESTDMSNEELLETIPENEVKPENTMEASVSSELKEVDSDGPEDMEFDEDGLPMVPDFDDFDDMFVEEEKEVEEEIIYVENLFALDKKNLLKLFLSQWTYWTLVFLIISISSYEITNPNIDFSNLSSTDFLIHSDAFIFGWITFVPMGWFFAYKLRSMRVIVKKRYIPVYLIGQYLWMIVVMTQLILVLNPNYLSGVYNPINYVLTVIFEFTYQNYLYSGIIAGFLLFYVSVFYIWNIIYELTPMSNLEPDLGNI